jgi:flagellar basal-body rod modification protein FlgD
MDIFGSNSITAAATAAQARIASALVPLAIAAKTTGSATSASSPTATTNAASGTITSSDFLTLLVSELKNQDPTQPTDPNAYIQQLVGVNSLQQLISINQGLTTIEPASGSK